MDVSATSPVAYSTRLRRKDRLSLSGRTTVRPPTSICCNENGSNNQSTSAIAKILVRPLERAICCLEEASPSFLAGALAKELSKYPLMAAAITLGTPSLSNSVVSWRGLLSLYPRRGCEPLSDDENIKEKLISLRYAGTVNREDCVIPSLNFRIHTLQAALLLVELKRIDKIISQRRRIAAHYEGLLRDVAVCPHEDNGSESVYYTYTIQVDHRDELRDFMANRNIETKIHHPILMPYHTAYNGCFSTDIPVAERAVQRILSIPNHENMTDDEVDYVASTILHFYSNKIA